MRIKELETQIQQLQDGLIKLKAEVLQIMFPSEKGWAIDAYTICKRIDDILKEVKNEKETNN